MNIDKQQYPRQSAQRCSQLLRIENSWKAPLQGIDFEMFLRGEQ